jgi:proteasome lid subunit RPN8/RPN11
VLVGNFAQAHERTVKTVIRCANATDSPRSRYHISPAELIRIQREARLAGHEIIGFYHSHPDCPSQWSSTDLAEAYWTGCSYVITQVDKGEAVHTSSFLLLGENDAKHFADEAIAISSSADFESTPKLDTT